MHEPLSDHRITVTGQERVHPAIQKLARACIALAHQLKPAALTRKATENTIHPRRSGDGHD